MDDGNLFVGSVAYEELAEWASDNVVVYGDGGLCEGRFDRRDEGWGMA